MEGHSSRDLTCRGREFDSAGWSRIAARLANHFEAIFEEQEDAKIRVAGTNEGLIRVGILQIAFESPRREGQIAIELTDGSGEPPVPFLERLAPIFADDLSMEIVATLNQRDMSVIRFHREFARDASEWAVRYRFDRLRELGWIAVVDEVRRRGAHEKICRATRPVMADGAPWANAPRKLEKTESWLAFTRLAGLVKESIASGAFDVRYDRHLTWSIVNLDRVGWENVTADLEKLEAFICEEEKQARKRIEAGAEPLTMVVGLGAFESPSGRVKAP